MTARASELPSIADPALYAAQAFRDTLRHAEIEVRGTTRVNIANQTWHDHLATIESPPLFLLLTTMLKNSQNLYAEMLFKNTGNGTFIDVTKTSGLQGRQALSTSALWLDYDRDGLLDLFVCNYVKWSPDHDVFCSLDGKSKAYCTPEAYRGSTCWLFRRYGMRWAPTG